jgi:outer membrane protein assembly factor BamB
VDATGAVFEDIQIEYGTESTVFALSPSGEVSWQWQAEGMQSLALSDDGTLFSVTIVYCVGFPNEKQVLTAINAETGTLLWQVTLSDNLLAFPDQPLPSLALTPHATLLTTDESNIYAVFAGQERPSTTAPWSRDRGGNDNRACASPP